MFSARFWNGKDAILKERLGLTNNQGNHGEDVKNSIFIKSRLLPTLLQILIQISSK
jgi:hypothetical protein